MRLPYHIFAIPLLERVKCSHGATSRVTAIVPIFCLFSNMCYGTAVVEVIKQRVNAALEPGSDEGVVFGNLFCNLESYDPSSKIISL